jgi:hypothetical protein
MHLTALLERVLSLLCEMTEFLTHPDFGKDLNIWIDWRTPEINFATDLSFQPALQSVDILTGITDGWSAHPMQKH